MHAEVGGERARSPSSAANPCEPSAHAALRGDPLGYGRQSIDEDDVAAVVRVLRGDHLTQGPEVPRFEAALAAATGARHAVAVANGSVALELAYLALGVGPGQPVWTSANTFLATATAAVRAGAEVAFLDIDARTMNVDVDALEHELVAGARPSLVTAVHFAGRPCAMARLLDLKRRFGFRLVEDAAHALGARWRADGRWWRVGEHPEVDAAVLSFHPVKHVTTGEGGALLCASSEVAARARTLRSHGIDREAGERPTGAQGGAQGGVQDGVQDGASSGSSGARPPRWFLPMTALGLNGRLSDLQAALGTSQLGKLARFLTRRRELAARYLAELADCFELPAGDGTDHQHAWHLFVIHVERGRDELQEFLHERGIGTQVHYYPVAHQPWFLRRYGHVELPRAAEHARTALSLPLHAALSDSDQGRVLEALRAWRGR
jgi:dTDP-4-amino-4,6-dideoxygalactose transaminase